MLIDWFTIFAQVLNFLILVWLMKRFLYKPILHAIDAREERIATQIADAETKESEAQKEREDFHEKNENFDHDRADLLKQVTAEAEEEKQRLLEEARSAAEALHQKRQETLRNEAHQLRQAIARRTQDEVFLIARKTLTDLASTPLEVQICDQFVDRIRTLDEADKQSLGEALSDQSDPALVRSAMDLPQAQRDQIQNTLNETFSAEIPLRFETDPDVISGIELNSNGQKVAWSIAEYLTSLEKSIGELLKEHGTAKTKTEANPVSETEET